jgi:amino acid transporter
MTLADAASAAADEHPAPQRLASGTVRLPGAVAQSAALVGPSVGVVVGNAFIASLAGAASVLAFMIGTAICVLIAKVISDFAKHLPSAGSFYTYLTHSFGAKTGFVTGVLLFGAYALLFPFQLSFFGYYAHGLVAADFGANIPWQLFAIALIVLSVTLAALGVQFSLKAGLLGLAFEISVFSIFAILVIVKGGANGQSLAPFDPSQAPKGFASGLLIACVYTIFAFVGFESATTLGEEAHEPKKTIPRAVMLTTLLLGAFFVVVTYAEVIGFGASTAGVGQLISDPTAFNTLAHRYGNGFLSGAIDVAVVFSFVALNIVTVNAVTRMLYAMGRDRMLPRGLAQLNRRRAPQNAAVTVGALGLAASLLFGSIYKPDVYASWSAYFATLLFIGAYVLLCVGIIRFKQRELGDAFSHARHSLIPVVSLAGIGLVLYGNVHPLPPSPLRWFIPATLGIIAVAAFAARRMEKVDPQRVQRAGRLFSGDDTELPAVASATMPVQSTASGSPVAGAAETHRGPNP